MPTPEDWSREEVSALVADYLHMLVQELAGQLYNKTAHRRALSTRLHNRSDGSIERKHQNVSAVLNEFGYPCISGYKPLANFQQLLLEVVFEHLQHDPLVDRAAISAAEQPAIAPLVVDFSTLLEDPPPLRQAETPKNPYRAPVVGFHRDYLAREALNRSLGQAGEEFVAHYEQFRLHSLGKSKLGDRVELVSQSRGDGLGYDVLSFEPDGRERFIEVKTTAFRKETPFYISRAEVDFSNFAFEQYYLYRLFEFRKLPRLFTVAGQIERRCILDPVSFLAKFS
jgi:hypothetical protein